MKKRKLGKLQLNRETLRTLNKEAISNVVGGVSVVDTDCGTCAADCPTGVNGTCSCGARSCVQPCVIAEVATKPQVLQGQN